MLSCELSNFCSAVCSHHMDNLSKPLQNLSISAVQGQEIAHLVIETLSKKRCNDKFWLLWFNLMNKETELRCTGPKAATQIKSYLIFIIPKVEMTVFTMIIQKNFIIICIVKPLIILQTALKITLIRHISRYKCISKKS